MGDSEKKHNGCVSDEVKLKNQTNESLMFNPLPQRVMRLNRRGFYLSGREKNKSPEQVKSLSNNLKETDLDASKRLKSEQVDREISSPSSGSKIIKLNSSKKNSDIGSGNFLKRTLSNEKNGLNSSNYQKQSVQETPRKKKHKPITWP